MASLTRKVRHPHKKIPAALRGAEKDGVSAAQHSEAAFEKSPDRLAAEAASDDDRPRFRVGDKLKLTVKEPEDRADGRPGKGKNYLPVEHVGEVEQQEETGATVTWMKVRWHLPAKLGYDTQKGTVSVLVHIAGSVWLEARKVPRNVAVVVARITEEEYRSLLSDAASPRPPAS